MIQYRFRLNVGRPETAYGLTGRELLIGRGTVVQERIPLSEIVRVNLQSHGLTIGKDMFRCVIRTRRKTILLSNIHYLGFARTEARDRAYRSFVLNLHKALSRCGNPVRFEVGHHLQALFGAAVMILAPLLLVAIVGVSLTKGPVPGLRIGLFGLAGYAGYAYRYWRTGRRNSYDPSAPPRQYLPAN